MIVAYVLLCSFAIGFGLVVLLDLTARIRTEAPEQQMKSALTREMGEIADLHCVPHAMGRAARRRLTRRIKLTRRRLERKVG